jgi:hypothetical protein
LVVGIRLIPTTNNCGAAVLELHIVPVAGGH